MLAVPRLIEVELVIEGLFAQIGKNCHPPTEQWIAIALRDRLGGEFAVCVMVVVHREHDLSEIVRRLHLPSRLASGLDRR